MPLGVSYTWWHDITPCKVDCVCSGAQMVRGVHAETRLVSRRGVVHPRDQVCGEQLVVGVALVEEPLGSGHLHILEEVLPVPHAFKPV